MNKVDGLIAFFGLQEWWFSSFTNDERDYIDNCYLPMGVPQHTLTRGTILGRRQPVSEFLNGLNTWFMSSKDSTIAERIHRKLTELGDEHPIVKPGYYNGRHFTTYVKDIESLKKNSKNIELEKLLIELVKATEAENAIDSMGIAPAYYCELAILYRKQKEYTKEVSILERFANQKHAPGVMPAKLLDRLNKAKDLVATKPNIPS
jgi:hypothetical protein